jgi:hypothetical protein
MSPPSRILERNSKENRYLPSKTPLLYPWCTKGEYEVAKYQVILLLFHRFRVEAFTATIHVYNYGVAKYQIMF